MAKQEANPTRKLAGRKPLGPARIENILSLRGSLEFKDWVDRLVMHSRSKRSAANASHLIELALILWAKQDDFAEEPPLR